MAQDDPTKSTPPTEPPWPGSSLGEQPGDFIGPYKLLAIIGEGGFGTVWLAERREPFVQRVALKIIKAGMDTKAAVARFEQERQALAVMDHPSVAKVHDAGMTATGRPYFVMEYVQGEPVTDFCDRHAYTIRQRLALFIPICEGVQHAHMKGIIHRDLKPSNILVMIRDGHAIPKVIDFGVAKAVSHTLTDKTIFTETGQIIGTPEYMSPEQAEMGGVDLDTRTDVYSLGVVLYELLAGVLPFDSSILRAASWDEMRRMIREDPAPRPSTRLSQALKASDSIRGPVAPDIHNVEDLQHATTILNNRANPGLRVGEADQPGSRRSSVNKIPSLRRTSPEQLASELRNELDLIPLKALRKDRTERYRTPTDLADDIANYLEGRPITPFPESTAYRVRKLVNRNRGVFVAGSAVVIALLIGVIAFAYQAHRIGLERDRARAAERTADANALKEADARKRADNISALLITFLNSGDPNSIGGRQDTTIPEAMQRALTDIESGVLKVDAESEAELLEMIATILMHNGHLEDARPRFEQALLTRTRIHPGDNQSVAGTMVNEADCLDELGHSEEAIALYESALQMLKRLFPSDSAEVARGIDKVGASKLRSGQPKDALPLLEEALRLRKACLPPDDLEIAQSLNNVAGCQAALGSPQTALPNFQRALEIKRIRLPDRHPDVATSMNNLAWCLATLGRSEDALPMMRTALESRQQRFHGDHPDVAASLDNVGTCLEPLGQLEEAQAKHNEALAMRQRLFPKGHRDVAMSLSNTASCSKRRGRNAEALQMFEAAANMRRVVFKGDHPELASSLDSLGTSLMEAGRLEDARRHLEGGLEMRRRLFKEGHPDTVTSLDNVARCLMSLKDVNAAVLKDEEALEMANRVFRAGHPAIATVLSNLAGCLEMARRREEALPKYVSALRMMQEASFGDNRQVATLQLNVAACQVRLGQWADALPASQAALAMWTRLIQGDSLEVAISLRYVAMSLRELGRVPEALDVAQQAADMAGRKLTNSDSGRKACEDTLAEIKRLVEASAGEPSAPK